MNLTKSPRLLIEPASPFVPRPRLEALETVEKEPPMAVTILKDPRTIATMIREGDRLDRLVLSSLACIGFASAVFVLVALANRDPTTLLRSSVLLPANFIFALAAALGPVYAVSIVYAARIPMARLVGALLSSTAVGAMMLAAVAPLPWFGFTMDPQWFGPICLVVAFGVAAATVGHRLKFTLLQLARGSAEELSDRDAQRVIVIARIASMVVGLTVAISLWGFDVLLPAK